MVVKRAQKTNLEQKLKLERPSWKNFKEQLKTNFPFFFLYFFLFWVAYGLYMGFLTLLGINALIISTYNPNTMMLILVLLELPFLYLFFVLSIYFLKRMFGLGFGVKDYFYFGLKLFIMDVLFVIVILLVGYFFLLYDSKLILILLFVVFLLMLFFIFASYKTVFTKSFANSFSLIFKQLGNIKAIAYFFLTLIVFCLAFGIVYGLTMLQVLPSIFGMVMYPLGMLFMFYMAHFSVRT